MEKTINDLDEPMTEKERMIFPGDEDLCRSLWMAVIIKAVQDAGSNCIKPCRVSAREEARNWLGIGKDEHHPDFEKICDLAGIDPDQLKPVIEQVLAGELPGFDFRVLKKLSSESQEQENRRKYFRRTRRRDHARRLRMSRGLAHRAMQHMRPKTMH